MKKRLLTATVALMTCASSHAALYITPDSAIASSNTINTAGVLISDATDASYVAPGPASGGSGTSWWSNQVGTTPVSVTFDFAAAQNLDTIHLWDYYGHSPTGWSVSFYDGASGTGNLLHNEAFSITPGVVLTSTYHEVSVSHTSGVASAVLTSTTNSTNGGVGLSEVAFGDSTVASVPEPSSVALMGLGGLCLLLRRRK